MTSHCDKCGEEANWIVAVRDSNGDTTIIKELCNKHYNEARQWLNFFAVEYVTPDSLDNVDDYFG